MANQTQKAIILAMETSDACKQLLDALDKLAALEQRRAKSFLDLNDFDADFEAYDQTAHLTGNTLINVLANSTAAVRSFIAANNHEDNFQLARR